MKFMLNSGGSKSYVLSDAGYCRLKQSWDEMQDQGTRLTTSSVILSRELISQTTFFQFSIITVNMLAKSLISILVGSLVSMLAKSLVNLLV